ncbi:ribonuclease H-like domain-containing protein [Tanacetum coccineum]
MAATTEHESALSEGGDHDILTIKHVQNDINQPLRRSERSFVFPNKYNEYVVDSKLNKAFELNSYWQACKEQHLIEAMNKEMKALYDNDTWEITELPSDRKTIRSKWVFKNKYKSDGEIERYKARLVAKGFNQKERVDFDETFSLVVKIVTVMCLLNLAVQNSLPLYQLDINNAFLYGDLDETIYMTLPEGQWNANLTQTLIDNGFSQSKSDYSLFTKSNDHGFLALLVYVDDIIVTGSNILEIEKFKEFLKSRFMIKDLGKFKYFLGIEVVDTDDGICLSQRKYCLDILSEFGLLACKPFVVPLEQNTSITSKSSDSDPVINNITEYQKIIGKLIYLTHTRPDIAYFVHCLSQFMHKSLKSHIKIALKLLRYLKGSFGKGIHISKNKDTSLEVFVDADWAKLRAQGPLLPSDESLKLGQAFKSWKIDSLVIGR